MPAFLALSWKELAVVNGTAADPIHGRVMAYPSTPALMIGSRFLLCRVVFEGQIDKPEIDRLDDGKRPTRRAELFHCILDMKVNRVLADAENHGDVPGRLPGRRPSQTFLFAIGPPHGTNAASRANLG